jgi:outer membrane protein OmpA-like peptidoglycan-associated protein
MKPLTFAISLALACASAAQAQTSDTKPDKMIAPMVPLTYVGSNARIGVSVNDDGDFSGEGLGIFRYTGTSAILGEGWIGQGGAGGVQLGFNWLWGAKDAQSAIDDPNKLFVAKVFAALDRNASRDRKATIGFGAEKNDLFFDAYVSKGLTDERFVSTRSVAATDVVSGLQGTRPFTQNRITTTIFDSFEQGYERAIGARLGRYFDSNLFRLRGGLDYATGDFSSNQLTASIGADKYFEGTGHSLSLDLAHASKNGDFVTDDNNTGAAITYRYAFGESYRPAAWEHAMANPQPDNPETKAMAEKTERVAVETKADLDSDSFFDFDKFALRTETKAELDRLVGVIKAAKLASPVTITGHTCSIGSDAYNVKLSNNRANAVAEYFKAAGIDAELAVSGAGEANPSFPNDTRENRKKNRRVDITFITVEEKFEDRTLPASDGGVTYSKQIVTVPPGWIERALRNPAEHRRDVDTFTFTKSRQEVALGPVVFTNRAPVAVNDTFAVRRNAPATLIPVLVNDTDLDADTLIVSSVTAPTNGTATISGGGVLYTPRTGFTGTDTFNYTVSDGKGGTATASVTVTVSDLAPTAVDDSLTIGRNASITVLPLANDRDPEGTVLRVTGIDQPSSGTAVLTGNEVRYTSTPGFVGTVMFAYRIVDEAGNPASAKIIITVTNAAPIANTDVVALSVGRPVMIDVLSNDSDPEGDAITLETVATPANGTAVIAGGKITYTPRAGFAGIDTFSYTIKDAFGATATGTVRVTVAANTAPNAVPDLAEVFKGRAVDINVLANDTDAEGDALTLVSVAGATQGILSINANGTVRYQHRPGTGSLGDDSFTYVVRDAAGNSSTGTVSVRVIRIVLPGG